MKMLSLDDAIKAVTMLLDAPDDIDKIRSCDVINNLKYAPSVEEIEPAQKWISVKDRLPEVGKVVLAFGTRSATTGMFQGISIRNDLWLWKGNTIKHVSHWMPLPEAPKEDVGR